MENLWIYLLESTVCLGVFWGIYRWGIEGCSGYNQARFYLLSVVWLSAIIPLLSIPILPAEKVIVPKVTTFSSETKEFPLEIEEGSTVSDNHSLTTTTTEPIQPFSLTSLIGYLYIGGLFGYLLLLLFNLHTIHRLVRYGKVTLLKHPAVKTVRHPNITVPFSFLHYVFLPEQMAEEEKQTVISHE